MAGHVSSEIATFGIEPLVADGTVHSIATVVGGDVFVSYLFVHEGLVAAGECTFPGSFFVFGGGEVFFGYVAC